MTASEEDTARKFEALEAYRSQFGANPANASVIATMRLRAAYWGGLVGAPAGEPFFSAEEIGVRSVGTWCDVMRVRKQTPTGHGEVLSDPPYGTWAMLATENARLARDWERSSLACRSRGFVARHVVRRRPRPQPSPGFLESPDAPPADPELPRDDRSPTGPLPSRYLGEGFLLQRLAEETGATRWTSSSILTVSTASSCACLSAA